MKSTLIRIAVVFIMLGAPVILRAQDTMVRRVQKSHGQTSPVIIWILVAVVPILFLIFAVSKSRKSKKEVVNDTNREERVVKDTLPKP